MAIRCQPLNIILPICMVLFGATVVTTKKLQFQQVVPGLITKPHAFRKPCLQVFMLNLAESLSLIVYLIYKGILHHRSHRKLKDPEKPEGPSEDSTTVANAPLLLNQEDLTQGEPENTPPKPLTCVQKIKSSSVVMLIIRMIVPSILDLGTGIMASFAMVYAAPSLMEVMTCTIILFTPIWGCLFLKKRFSALQIISVIVALGGTILSSCSSFLTKPMTGEIPWLGVVLMLSAQLCSSLQYVIEERLMLKKRYHPLLAIGVEGCIGMVLMVFILILFQNIPGPESGKLENTLDTFVQIRNSNTIVILLVIYTLAAAVFLSSGIQVTRRLSSVHRVLISSCKAGVVWIVHLIMYPVTSHKYGEAWNMASSLMQLFGFLILVTGNIMFQLSTMHRVKKLKQLEMNKKQAEEEAVPSSDPPTTETLV
ncbi:putative Solute carrier family 35 member F6 [Blattamonas nauphoetae]|uniref:Solute carrier family 35 member F6 n=1 Tax=Blattamonas nauphoetae TaxID=2049346 RepID=A0ABQ9YKG5_9EUKA|nr:putative Solute carrier family 35 member F6 [Blattamonas nauphoetae]